MPYNSSTYGQSIFDNMKWRKCLQVWLYTYFFVILFDESKANISRDKFYKLCNDCGLEIRKDYVNPAYYNTLYLKKNIYPKKNQFLKKYNYYRDLNY